ncbi:WhiB family transcriptional regulator [Cellulomonas sp. zg-ZUI222]|uniref:WhiB family transcriptional regulator n=1 Tax=Cellulomonas wangleii TaxID=2816956 RepID=UPI001A951C12|nr:WhiB family transcriptional regulator [Cellulomonas wangleii]MBO0920362.1 WhiB family transcriptional regulator [Cellulomonas wangleii]
MKGDSARTNLLEAIGYAEAVAGGAMPCRRRDEPLAAEHCRRCPALATCQAFAVRHPGALGWYGGKTTDPVQPYRVRWQKQVRQVNEMREQS